MSIRLSKICLFLEVVRRKCSMYGAKSAFTHVSVHSGRIVGTECPFASYTVPQSSSFKINHLSKWSLFKYVPAVLSGTDVPSPLFHSPFLLSLIKLSHCFSVHPYPSLFLSETISGFSNWLPSTAAITDMGRSEEGGARGRRRRMWRKDMKPKRGLFLFDVPLTNVSYLSFPVPYAGIIVLENCIPSVGKRTHCSYLVSGPLAIHICPVIRLISLDVLGPPAWRRLEFWWPN